MDAPPPITSAPAAWLCGQFRWDNSARILPQQGPNRSERGNGEVNPLQVRVAQKTEGERLVPLINAAFRRAESYIVDSDRIDLATVQSLLGRGEFLVAEDLVADDKDSLAGCVYLERRGDRAYLGLLSVAPERQKGGIGSMLMREAEQRCARAGCCFMDLRTINLREDNRVFYRRRGYVETGTEPFPREIETKVPCYFVNMSKPLG